MAGRELLIQRDDALTTMIPGMRFQPNEHELIDGYLLPKKRGETLPGNDTVVFETDIKKNSPIEIAGMYDPFVNDDGTSHWYFFTQRYAKSSGANRPDRTTEKGYWKITGSEKGMKYKGSIIKATLKYYIGAGPTAIKTAWLITEYRINGQRESDLLLDGAVLCHMHKTGKGDDGDAEVNGDNVGQGQEA